NEKQEVVYWQKTEISTQDIQKDEWVHLYTNLIISKKNYDKKGLKFSAYIWNLNRDDFYVDDMKIIIKAL
ncbi:MAG: hypothetical protein P1P88_11480, partial [Bacteroidales bacterium]|nr:hypothetical protein [Bacteroidales bacterium]